MPLLYNRILGPSQVHAYAGILNMNISINTKRTIICIAEEDYPIQQTEEATDVSVGAASMAHEDPTGGLLPAAVASTKDYLLEIELELKLTHLVICLNST